MSPVAQPLQIAEADTAVTRPDVTTRQSITPEKHFNARYYAKWYDEDIATRQYIADKAARFVLSYVEHMDSEIATVLDVGCGLGLWKKALMKQDRRLRYTGVEWSSHLCRKLGWEQGDVRTYAPRRTFDLVICQAVLQYLPDAECAAAIDNLARLSRRFLYLEVLTAADAKEICEPRRHRFRRAREERRLVRAPHRAALREPGRRALRETRHEAALLRALDHRHARSVTVNVAGAVTREPTSIPGPRRHARDEEHFPHRFVENQTFPGSTRLQRRRGSTDLYACA